MYVRRAAAVRRGTLSKKVKKRRCRRTCADDSDTYREILWQIVCEERSDECAICHKILSKGIPKGEIAALGNCRARLLPPLQRVELLDTLKRRSPFLGGPALRWL